MPVTYCSSSLATVGNVLSVHFHNRCNAKGEPLAVLKLLYKTSMSAYMSPASGIRKCHVAFAHTAHLHLKQDLKLAIQINIYTIPRINIKYALQASSLGACGGSLWWWQVNNLEGPFPGQSIVILVLIPQAPQRLHILRMHLRHHPAQHPQASVREPLDKAVVHGQSMSSPSHYNVP